jgi:four helix bundle protein
MKDNGREYDLTERTAVYGEDVVRFANSIRVTPVTKPLVSQFVRAGTSIGANYGEADESGSKKEFRYRISLCKRESRETKHWLRMLVAANADLRDGARKFWMEADELTRIFAAIYRNSSDDET